MANQRPTRPGGGPKRGPSQGRRPKGPAPRPAKAVQKPRPERSKSKSEPESEGGLERLQKVLAHAGIGSRRSCEDVILQGRVTVDGQVVRELGSRVDPRRSKIAVDGQRIHSERMVYFAVNKPKGYVSTNNDPSGRPRVVDILPEIPQRVYTVGRLDEMSTGLILLTNDGELANRLAHPKFGVEKLYRVVVAGSPEREVLNKLTDGVWLAEGKVRARRVRVVAKKGQATVLEMVLAEGKNREVRRMMAKFGHKVMTLTRVAVGPITLKGLAPGQFRPLSHAEVDLLQKVAAGIPVPSPRFPDRAPKRSAPPRPRPSVGGQATEGRRQGPASRAGGPPARPMERRPGPQGPGGQRRPPASARGNAGGPGRGATSSPPPSQRPARPLGPPPSQRPARPLGPPPSQRRPAPEAAPRRPAPPSDEPPRRRIIGLAPGTDRERPPSRRLPPKRRFPRASLGPRRPRSSDEGDE